MLPVTERRRSVRRAPGYGEPLRRVRSRTGRDLDVIDVSNTGLLIEGQPRLLPNTHLDIHVVTRAGRILVRCRVVRAWVWHLEADLVRYRVALAFDQMVDTSAGYPVPSAFQGDFRDSGTAYPGDTSGADATSQESSCAGQFAPVSSRGTHLG